MGTQFITGLDLGCAQDPTAVVILERSLVAPDPKKPDNLVRHYDLRHLERFPLGTPYPDVADRVRELFDVPPLAGSVLGVDQTGVGAPVIHWLRKAKIRARLCPVLITGGHAATEAEDGWHVPKKELVSVTQLALGGRRLHIAKSLREAKTLVKELANFKAKITAAANETFAADWREGQHDDLVLATAIALWLAEKTRGLAFTPSPPSAASLNVGEQLARLGVFGPQPRDMRAFFGDR